MRFSSVVLRLSSVNVLTLLLAFVTSPILARSLGPSGRGEIAAIFSIVTLAPYLCDVGVTAYLGRESARGVHRIGDLLGSVLPIALLASLGSVAAAVPLAHLLGQGRPDVVRFIEIGLFVVPASVALLTLSGLSVGLQHWKLVTRCRLFGIVAPAIAVVVLALANAIDVERVAIVYFVTGMLSLAPFVLELRRVRPLRSEGREQVDSSA